MSILALTASLGAQHQAAAQTAPAPAKTGAGGTAVEQVIVTAQKRQETLQSVAASVEVLTARQIQQLNITDFQDYQKFLPSLSFQTLGPNQTSVYLRGVSSGDNANHSGPLPTVGTYFDEMPITTIGGTLDMNMYDTTRIEVLPGPQGTLYGASSEAGTIRIISNKPNPNKFEAGYSLEGNLTAGDTGHDFDGFVNLPVTNNVAIRLVGWDQRTPGYIDNVAATRTFATSGTTINNSSLVKNDQNNSTNVGGRAAVAWDINENWTATVNLIGQDQEINGAYGYLPSVGDLKTERFSPDRDHDYWAQAGLTVKGKVGNFDLTYSGGYFARHIYQRQDYTDYSVFYDGVYGSGSIWQDAKGNPLSDPQQTNINNYHYYKYDNELRIASPATDRLRFIAGAFWEEQRHHIIQNQFFSEGGLSPQLSPTNWPNTLWLTDQTRIDRDVAAFTEASFDITPKLTLLAGVRPYYYNNTLSGFFGYSQGYDELSGFSSGPGADGQNCLGGAQMANTPCTNLRKGAHGSGETHKINLTYKFNPNNLVYFTYSTGYRPGGVNRNGDFGAYKADTLTNYELGLKTSLFHNSLVWNTTLYDEDWDQFQFSFLGPNDLTVIENAPQANIKGLESSVNWNATRQLAINGGFTLTRAVLTKNFCGTDQSTGNLIQSCSSADAVAPGGAHLPYTPAFKGYASARYAFDLTSDWKAFGQGVVTYQTMSHVGLRTSDNDELGAMPAYATVDISAGADRNKLGFEFFVKNLFDSRGEENRYTACPVQLCTQSLPGVPHSVYVLPIMPRTIGIKVHQSF